MLCFLSKSLIITAREAAGTRGGGPRLVLIYTDSLPPSTTPWMSLRRRGEKQKGGGPVEGGLLLGEEGDGVPNDPAGC